MAIDRALDWLKWLSLGAAFLYALIWFWPVATEMQRHVSSGEPWPAGLRARMRRRSLILLAILVPALLAQVAQLGLLFWRSAAR